MRLRSRPSFPAAFPSGGDLGSAAKPSASGSPLGRSAFRLGLIVLFLAGLVFALPRLAGDPGAGPAVERARAEGGGPRLAPSTAAPAPAPGVAPTLAAAPQPTIASDAWSKMPKMALEAVYGGPLRDTIVQRWRDPVDGTVCYLYLPINAPTTPVQPSGFVQYGAATIGSIACFPAPMPPQQVAAKPAAAPPVAPPAAKAPPVKPAP